MGQENVFEVLSAVDVSSYIEKKDGLTYLSWAHAWREVCKRYPEATYSVQKHNGVPWVGTSEIGYMVYTTVTIDGLTHEMWLPVLDSKNKPMNDKPYKYRTKYGEKEVAAIDSFAVNKTIMRCLTKNLAMFGLGIHLYAGEDLPEVKAEQKDTAYLERKRMLIDACKKEGVDIVDFGKKHNAKQKLESDAGFAELMKILVKQFDGEVVK